MKPNHPDVPLMDTDIFEVFLEKRCKHGAT